MLILTLSSAGNHLLIGDNKKEANSYDYEFASFFITQPTGRSKPPYVTSQRFLSAHQRPREKIGQDGLQPGIIDDNGVI